MKTILAMVALLVVSFGVTRPVSADASLIPANVSPEARVEAIWGGVANLVDDIAAKKVLVKSLTRPRDLQERKSTMEAIAIETKELCADRKDYTDSLKQVPAAGGFEKRAAIHCTYEAPHMMVHGKDYQLTAECRQVFESVCK